MKTEIEKIVKILLLFKIILICDCQHTPMVINTWAFTNATIEAWQTLNTKGNTALDAVEIGCMTCEKLQCDGTVGFGGSPDENGETTLDAMIMNGADMNIGAVAGVRRIKNVISLARYVLEYTEHTLLVGDQATKFAKNMGFVEESLSTSSSHKIWKDWKKNHCQPNFWTNVTPNPKLQCGPYQPNHPNSIPYTHEKINNFGNKNHDTIGMIAIDKDRNIVAGTSTNGARHKIPGRVGDSPIPGAGAYADNDIGAAVATGDGDIMMRFLPSFLAVEEMRRGNSPKVAAQIAIQRVINKHPTFFGGIVVVNKIGEYAAACRGMKEFPFSLANKLNQNVSVITVNCE